jgi:hypothetical protein
VAEEYCGAITQANGRCSYDISDWSVLEFGFEVDSLVYTHVVGHVCTQF